MLILFLILLLDSLSARRILSPDSLADSLARFARRILLLILFLILLLDSLSARWIPSLGSLADSLSRFALGSLDSLAGFSH